MLNTSDLRLPKFNQDFEDTYTRFGQIKWTRDANRVNHGENLMNDYLLSFYKDILKLAGKEKEFDSYLNKMNELQSLMIGNEMINPYKYLSIRSQMEREVREVAQTVFAKGLDRKNKVVRNMIKNPVYTIMGGPEYFRGYSFEKSPGINLKRLRIIKENADDITRLRDEMDFSSNEYKRDIQEMLDKCGQ